MFRVGQKVVCVDDGPHQNRYAAAVNLRVNLTRGVVYTITGFAPRDCNGVVGLYLRNTPAGWICFKGHEIGWAPSRFRPVVERKTDISVFTKLLTPTPARTKELCDND